MIHPAANASGTGAGSLPSPDRKPDRAKLGTMETPEIITYLKTSCGWSAGVRAVLAKYNLKYTEKDIIQNPAFRWEMETKSGQPLSPCVEINGEMLADVSGEEVETYLIDNKIVQPSETDAGVPLNAPCSTEQHDSAVKLRL
jgi:glutaredoxin-related protein